MMFIASKAHFLKTYKGYGIRPDMVFIFSGSIAMRVTETDSESAVVSVGRMVDTTFLTIDSETARDFIISYSAGIKDWDTFYNLCDEFNISVYDNEESGYTLIIPRKSPRPMQRLFDYLGEYKPKSNNNVKVEVLEDRTKFVIKDVILEVMGNPTYELL